MKSPLEVALFRVHCTAQMLLDVSKEKPVGLEEYQTMMACMAQLSHCCAVLSAAVENKIGRKIEVEELMLDTDVIPPDYAGPVNEIVRESFEK